MISAKIQNKMHDVTITHASGELRRELLCFEYCICLLKHKTLRESCNPFPMGTESNISINHHNEQMKDLCIGIIIKSIQTQNILNAKL